MFSPFKAGQSYYLANPPSMPGTVIRVIAGIGGYYHADHKKDEKLAQEVADNMNGGALDPDVAEAALAGSMFGWSVPGANPEYYRVERERKRERAGN